MHESNHCYEDTNGLPSRRVGARMPAVVTFGCVAYCLGAVVVLLVIGLLIRAMQTGQAIEPEVRELILSLAPWDVFCVIFVAGAMRGWRAIWFSQVLVTIGSWLLVFSFNYDGGGPNLFVFAGFLNVFVQTLIQMLWLRADARRWFHLAR